MKSNVELGALGRVLIGAFQCSSASRKFLNRRRKRRAVSADVFQCSSASRKFLNRRWDGARRCGYGKFQCSSASRKFLNSKSSTARDAGCAFQCSSASRKFLNILPHQSDAAPTARFSALQRAENSSISSSASQCGCSGCVSVLFSEPKIPQSRGLPRVVCIARRGFSALQRAENSSIRHKPIAHDRPPTFQCSSASRKFLNSPGGSVVTLSSARFSALQRAENSSIS